MSRPLKLTKTVSGTTKVGVIGDTGLSGNQLSVRFKTGGTEYNGYIVKQVGSKRFKCTDGSGHTAICTLVNVANNSLTNGDMTITATKEDTSTFRVAKISGKTVTNFSGNKFAWTASGSADASSTPLATVTLARA